MAQKVNAALVDKVGDKLSNLILETKSRLKDCAYTDLRFRVSETQAATAQDGMMKFSIRDYGLSYGVRVIAGRQLVAPGYFAETLGAADVDNVPDIVRDGVRQAYQRAVANSEFKSERKASGGKTSARGVSRLLSASKTQGSW